MTIIVHKGRTKTMGVSVMSDLSNDICIFEIRVERNRTSLLIATWEVEFATDGKDGELILSLDDSVTSSITQRTGWMDGKRLVGGPGGEPYPLISTPLQVSFREVVTA